MPKQVSWESFQKASCHKPSLKKNHVDPQVSNKSIKAHSGFFYSVHAISEDQYQIKDLQLRSDDQIYSKKIKCDYDVPQS